MGFCMSWFKNLSIRVKVLSVSLVSLLGFLFYLGLGFYASRDVASYLESIQSADIPALQRINANTVGLVNLRESYAAAITDHDEMILTEARQAAAAVQKSLEGSLVQDPKARAEQQKLIESFSVYNRHADALAHDMVASTVSSEDAKPRLLELSPAAAHA